MAVEVETRKTKVTADDASNCLDALMAIDAEVRSQQGGAIGTGLYALLELVGTQMMGLPRVPGWTPEPPAPATQAAQEPVKHDPAKAPPHAPAPAVRR
jgi:hypothetical protein